VRPWSPEYSFFCTRQRPTRRAAGCTGTLYEEAIRLRGGRQGAPAPCTKKLFAYAAGGRVRRHPVRRSYSPTRRAPGCAGALHPGEGLAPLRTAIRCGCTAGVKRAWLRADRIRQQYMRACGATKACAGALIVRQASLAGGLGACYAPSGKREGQRPLACILANLPCERGARGAAPTRMQAIPNIKATGSARGATQSHTSSR
jgi:hypothetical protein